MQINLDKICWFTIPRLTPSNNELLRMHHMERAKLNNTWFWEIKAAANAFEHNRDVIPRCAAPVKRGVRIVSYRKQKMDADNFFGGLKPLIDALVSVRLIWDDSPDLLELKAEIQLDMDNQRTHIELSF